MCVSLYGYRFLFHFYFLFSCFDFSPMVLFCFLDFWVLCCIGFCLLLRKKKLSKQEWGEDLEELELGKIMIKIFIILKVLKEVIKKFPHRKQLGAEKVYLA